MGSVALGLPVAFAAALAIDLVRNGHVHVGSCQSTADLVELLNSGVCEFALVAADAGYLTADVVAAADTAGVRIVALFGSEAERRYAVSLGLWEAVDASCRWPELEAMMVGSAPITTVPVWSESAVIVALSAPAIALPSLTQGETSAPGQVIAVWGPAGSPGRTTIAIALAAELASLGYSVVLADVDTHGASVALSLGMLDESPGFAAACRLAGTNSLTGVELDRIANHYDSGHGSFRVLTGIGRPGRWPELSTERVVTTIAACRVWADFVILDTGASLENDEEISSDLFAPRRNAATITAIREADQVFAVGSADPVGLSRFLRAYVDLLETVQTDRVTVIMNRVRASAIGLNATAQVHQALERFGGIRTPILIPDDRAAFDSAVLGGRTLRDVAPRSPARLAVAALVADAFPKTGAPRRRRPRSRVS